MSRSEAERIADALDHLEALHRHLQRHDLADETVVDAVNLRLAAAIEALTGNDAMLVRRLFGDDWNLMWSVRNRIAHGYAYIDLAVVAATVRDDLPAFEEILRQEYSRLRDG